jgi:hypothetical protein
MRVLAIQSHPDITSSLLFVNINGIPTVYAVRLVSIRRPDDDPTRVETCSQFQLINIDVFDVLLIFCTFTAT